MTEVHTIARVASCAPRSKAVLKVLYNQDDRIFGFDLMDDEGDRVMIAVSYTDAMLVATRIYQEADGEERV